jgi:hypothetical protein
VTALLNQSTICKSRRRHGSPLLVKPTARIVDACQSHARLHTARWLFMHRGGSHRSDLLEPLFLDTDPRLDLPDPAIGALRPAAHLQAHRNRKSRATRRSHQNTPFHCEIAQNYTPLTARSNAGTTPTEKFDHTSLIIPPGPP